MAENVQGVAETRERLSELVRAMTEDPLHPPVFFGQHRKPQVVLSPYRPGISHPAAPTMELLRSKLSAMKTLARAHGFSTGFVIGSVARGESRDTSDVDLLCDAEPETSLFDVSALELELEQLLGFPVSVIPRHPTGGDFPLEGEKEAIRLW